jgi:hypothetical protein
VAGSTPPERFPATVTGQHRREDRMTTTDARFLDNEVRTPIEVSIGRDNFMLTEDEAVTLYAKLNSALDDADGREDWTFTFEEDDRPPIQSNENYTPSGSGSSF